MISLLLTCALLAAFVIADHIVRTRDMKRLRALYEQFGADIDRRIATLKEINQLRKEADEVLLASLERIETKQPAAAEHSN